MVRCYDFVTGHRYHLLDVTFLETVPFFSGFPSSLGPTSELIVEEDFAPPCLLPILEYPSPSPSGSHAQALLPTSSPNSGISSPLVSDIPSPHYPTRVRRPSFIFFFQIILIILLRSICLTKVFQTSISLFLVRWTRSQFLSPFMMLFIIFNGFLQ